MDPLTGVSQVSPDDPEVAALLQRHLDLMQAQSPPESCHALPGDALKAPGITVLGFYEEGCLLAVGALKDCGAYGEIKSMHTAAEARGRGAARRLLSALLAQARQAGLDRVSLETGSGPEHAAARALYAGAGFTVCGPFGDYEPDPLSHFMTRPL